MAVKPEAHQEEFKEKQLQAVDSIYVESTDSVNFIKAVRIGLITAETRDKIEKALGPDHVEILKTARDRILGENGPTVSKKKTESTRRKAAMRLAFERVYGKFLFEEEYEKLAVGDPRRELDSKIGKKLSQVLKIRPDEKTGIAGRSELLSARKRLMMLSPDNPDDVLDEAFQIGKILSPEDKKTLVDEAIVSLQPLDDAVEPGYKTEFDATRALVKQPYVKKELEDAITAFKDLRAFSKPAPRKIIDMVVGKLEQVVGIGSELSMQRAEAHLKGAEEKLKKAEDLRTYFEKNTTPDINASIGELVKQTKDSSGNEKKFPDPEGKTDAAKNIIEHNYYDVGLRENIEALTALMESMKNDKQKKTGPEREAFDKKIISIQRTLSALNALNRTAKTTHNLLLNFASNASFLAKNNFLHKDFDPIQIAEIETKLKGLDPESSSVSVKDLDTLYKKLRDDGWFKVFNIDLSEAFARKIVDFKKSVHHSKEDREKKEREHHSVHDLSDTEAAKKIILAVVKRQHPKLSLEEQHNLANLILADDVAVIQTKKSYADLAKEGSEDLERLVRSASENDFRWKILKFRYQVDGKVFEPFKGLKSGDLNVWAKVEKQFSAAGKFDYQSGFYFLAAIKKFFGEDRGSFTMVYKHLEKKLKAIIAERIGVSRRMGESYVRRLVDEAFDHQLKESGELMGAHFDNYDKNKGDINKAKLKELKHQLKEIDEKRKLGKIDQEVYEEKYEKIMKEAKEYGLSKDSIDFVEDATLRGYYNSPEAQWAKDLAVDVGRYGKDKAWALVKGTAATGLNATVGAAKVGTSLTFQGLVTPFRIAKYPLLLAAKPAAGFLNLFRTNKLTPPGVIDTLKQDVGRVGTYFSAIGTESLEGAKKKTAEAYTKPWSEAQFKRVKYSERTKVKMDEEAARIKELAEKAELKPLEIAHAPTIDFEAIRKKIEDSDKTNGGHAHLEEAKKGEDKNVGKAPKAEESPAHPAANHDKEEKKDDHGEAHGHAHAHAA